MIPPHHYLAPQKWDILERIIQVCVCAHHTNGINQRFSLFADATLFIEYVTEKNSS